MGQKYYFHLGPSFKLWKYFIENTKADTFNPNKYKCTADPAVYILAGVIPIESRIHKLALGMYAIICKTTNSIEREIAERQLGMKAINDNNWFSKHSEKHYSSYHTTQGKHPIFHHIKSNNSVTAKVKIVKKRDPPLFTSRQLIKFKILSNTTQVIVRHRICLKTDGHGETSIHPYNFVAGWYNNILKTLPNNRRKGL